MCPADFVLTARFAHASRANASAALEPKHEEAAVRGFSKLVEELAATA